MLYHGLCFHRDFDADICEIKVLKCKFKHLGENGASCYVKYNINNSRLTDVDMVGEEQHYEYDNSSWMLKNIQPPEPLKPPDINEINFEDEETPF
jgi:hypothetical protein